MARFAWIMAGLFFLSISTFANDPCENYEVFNSIIDDMPCGTSSAISPDEIKKIREEGQKLGDTKSSHGRFSQLGTFINDIIFREQDEVADAIFDAIGDWTVDIEILNKEFGFDGRDDGLQVKAPIEFNPTRQVLLNNIGTVDEDGNQSENFSSQFTVISGLNLKLKPEAYVDTGDVSFRVSGGEGGIALKLVKQQAFPSQIRLKTNSPDPSSEIAPFFTISDQKEMKSKSGRWQRMLDWIGEKTAVAAKGFSNALNKYVLKHFMDGDTSKTFSEDSMSAFSQTTNFINTNSDKIYNPRISNDGEAAKMAIQTDNIADDSVMAPGDILSVIYYRTFGPNVTAGAHSLKIKAAIKNMRTVVHKSVQKKENGKVLVKYQEVVTIGSIYGGGVDLSIGIGPFSVGFRPLWIEVQRFGENGKKITRESTYEFDLTDMTARRAFDDVFKGVLPNWRAFDEEGNEIESNFTKAWNSGKIVTLSPRQRTPIGGPKNNTRYRFDLDVGAYSWDIKSNNQQELRLEYDPQNVKFITDIDGSLKPIGESVVGLAERNRRFQSRLFYRDKEVSSNSFRSTIKTDKSEKVESVVLQFRSTFSDDVSRSNEYAYYGSYLNLALGRGQLLPNDIRREILEKLGRKLPDGRSWQYLHLNIQLNEEITTRIFQKNQKDLAQVLEKLFGQQGSGWTSLSKVEAWKKKMKRKKCSVDSVIFDGDGLFDNRGTIKEPTRTFFCSKIADEAIEYLQFFNRIKPMDARKRSIEFNRFVKFNKYRTAPILYTMIKLGIDDNNLQRALKEEWVRYNLELEGEDMVGFTQVTNGSLIDLDPRSEDDFDVAFYNNTERRIRNSTVYKHDGSTYLLFDTHSALPTTALVKGIFYRFKRIFADKAVAFTLANQLTALIIKGRDGITKFKYGIRLPEDLLNKFHQKKDYTIQFWVEGAESERDTETEEVKFVLKK